MGIRMSFHVGQFPMGEESPGAGIFIGSGPTPYLALSMAAQRAAAFYEGRPRMLARWRAACALDRDAIRGMEEDPNPFAGEEPYNCRLSIMERHTDTLGG